MAEVNLTLCELEVKDVASMNAIVNALGTNGYAIQVYGVPHEHQSNVHHWVLRVQRKR